MVALDFEISEALIPERVDSDDAGDFLGMMDVRNVVALEGLGPKDVVTPEAMLPRYRISSAGNRTWLVAKSGGRAIGRGLCSFLFDESAPECEVLVEVLPEFRGHGVGTALLDRVVAIARDHGKRFAHCTRMGRVGEPGETVSATSGFGEVPADLPGTIFAVRHGAELAQVMRGSVLRLPADERLLEPLYSEAAAFGAGYESVSWVGPTPERWLDDLAVLRTRMSTDAPAGDREATEDVWDADRVRLGDAEYVEGGSIVLTTASIDRRTGGLAGFTEIEVLPDNARYAYQLFTLVLKEHRGHRLGMLLKIENIRQLEQFRPEVDELQTMNAEENRPMLSVNEALGFRRSEFAAVWKLRL